MAPAKQEREARAIAGPSPPRDSGPGMSGSGTLTPVSYNEEAAWLDSRREPARFARRVMRVTAELPPGLGAAGVRAVTDHLVRRHPILRTAYPTVAGEPRRLVLDEYAHEIEEEVPGGLPAPGPELGPGEVVRVWRDGDGRPRMGIDLSEMVTDPWSCARLQSELAALLATYADGRAPALDPVSATYAEFAIEQREHVAAAASARLREYWVAQLRGAAPATYLPADGPDPGGDLAGERICVLTEELMGCLRTLTRRHRMTPFMAVVAVLVMALAAVSGDRELPIATAVAGRQGRWADVQGSFANTLVLRTVLPDDPTFDGVAAAVRRAVVGGLAHGELPNLVVREALGEDAPDEPPLRVGYLASRGHQFTSLDERSWGQEWTEETDFSPRPIDLGFAEDAHGRVALWVNYDAALYTHALIRRLVGATWTTLRLAGADPGLTCARLAPALAG